MDNFIKVCLLLAIAVCQVSARCDSSYVQYLKTTDRCAHLFEEKDCRGRSFSPGKNREVGDLGQMENIVSSMVVMDGCQFTVYQEKGFKGEVKTYTEGDYPTLQAGFFFAKAWNDNISSYKCTCEDDGRTDRNRDRENERNRGRGRNRGERGERGNRRNRGRGGRGRG